MYGKFIRSAAAAVIAAVVAGILAFALGPFMQFMGPEGGIMYRSFDAIADNALLIMLLSLVLALIGRAVVESRVGGI